MFDSTHVCVCRPVGTVSLWNLQPQGIKIKSWARGRNRVCASAVTDEGWKSVDELKRQITPCRATQVHFESYMYSAERLRLISRMHSVYFDLRTAALPLPLVPKTPFLPIWTIFTAREGLVCMHDALRKKRMNEGINKSNMHYYEGIPAMIFTGIFLILEITQCIVHIISVFFFCFSSDFFLKAYISK